MDKNRKEVIGKKMITLFFKQEPITIESLNHGEDNLNVTKEEYRECLKILLELKNFIQPKGQSRH